MATLEPSFLRLSTFCIRTMVSSHDGGTASNSESMHAKAEGDNAADSLPAWFPKRCSNSKPIYHGNRDAFGWALDSVGRSVAFIGSGAFLGTALLRLAKESVGCGGDIDDECDGRVWGLIRPSSILTTYTIIVGVLSAATLPMMGAIADFTNHRRLMGRCFSVGLCLFILPQIFLLSQSLWLAAAFLQVGVAFTGWAQTMVTFAYLPELTDCEERLSQYQQNFTIVSFGSMIVYLLVVVGIATYAGLGDIGTARMATAISFVVCSSFLFVAWGPLLRWRPAAREIPEGRPVCVAGFVQVYHTMIHIYRNFPALKWFYVSVALVDAGVKYVVQCSGAFVYAIFSPPRLSYSTLATVMITYTTNTLDFTSTENGIAMLMMLIGSIPGAKVAGATIQRWNPVWSNMLATALLAVGTLLAAAILQRPGQQIETYAIAAVWGIATGWKWTTDRMLASILVPKGQDAELMGVYLFASQILTWIPPLIFTALNEAGVNQSIGIGSLCLYFCLGFACLCMIGDYRDAIEQSGRQNDDNSDAVRDSEDA